MAYNLTSPATCNEGLLGPTLADACRTSTFVAFLSILNALVRDNKKISGICERVESVKRVDNVYDFVVIGGGAAGSVVAGRLSENPDWKVLLLEAGPDEPVGAEVPMFQAKYLGTEIDWKYKTTNESNACLSTNGSCDWPMGKVLGGSTSHNGMVYLRGNPTDYNNWADQGNEGWTWEEVLPFYMKGEDNGEIDRVGREHHGTGGPLSVERFPYKHPFADSVLSAAAEAGYGVSDDLNGETFVGFSHSQAMNKNGVRRSSSRSYLWPVRNRKNLHISLKSTVTRLIIKNNKAVGVEYHKGCKRRRVFVTREVIVSAGAVKSPHILLHSGIGPKEHLESVGVKVVKNLPGVGENLHDHPGINMTFTINDVDTYENDWQAAQEYLNSQTGPLAGIGTSDVIGMIASNATTSAYPDIEVYVKAYVDACASGVVGDLRSTGKRSVWLVPTLLHPKSKGRVTLASKDPFKQPVIWGNYLGEPEDMERMIEGVKMVEKLVATEALRPYDFTPQPISTLCSDYEFLTDEYWACEIRQNTAVMNHQGGSCKMGPSSDPMAVVDARLRVYGIEGLRVADASIMPQVTSCNTAGPTIMIGERAADFIKTDWNRKLVQRDNCSDRI